MSSQTTKSKNYWNNKIIDWENSIKGQGNVSTVEKLAGHFRRPVKFRANICADLIRSFSKGKSVVELGCASGYFAFNLLETGQPKHITGIDISENAIARAKELAKEKGVEDKCNFQLADAASFDLPEADLTIGLGFLDYLNPEEITRLFKSIKSKYFLFTFSKKEISVLRGIHIVYLLSQKCPKHFYYTPKQIASFIGSEHGNVQFVNHNKMSFGSIVHNLPVQ